MYSGMGLMIDGRWRQASGGRTLAVVSPVTEEVVGSVPAAAPADVEDALTSAADAFVRWRAVPAWERCAILQRMWQRMIEQKARFAEVVSRETGKPLRESESETVAAAEQFAWYGEEAKRIYGMTVPSRARDVRISVNYEPVGVCVALSAWNFPILLPARKVAAALAAGCSVILRPSSDTPGAALLMAACALEAGLPAGAFNVLTGSSSELAAPLITARVVRKVSLTGSARVGREVLRLCADKITRASMELGGHAPVIVHADADPVQAAQALAAAKFRNAGQVCISPSRFLVDDRIRPAFEAAFADYARSLRLGDGLDPATHMGPLLNRRGREHALRLVRDAVDGGARLLTGGRVPEGFSKGFFIEPTVLGSTPCGTAIMREEPFAPIAPVTGFRDPHEALALANALPYGLAGYVFTRDAALATWTAEGLEVGMVGVNDLLLATAEAPFGGVKESGFGREGGALGILDYLNPKYVKHKLLGMP
jgi:succinate-semialdehyde dehydrogenase / glutarate-semialdehyde dehydrogenase